MVKTKRSKKETSIGRTTNYPVADFLARVKNAILARKKSVTMNNIKLVKEVAKTMVKLGFLDKVAEVDDQIVVYLAYKHKKPLLINSKVVSRPGLRVYMGVDEIEEQKGPSTLIISTPKGVMTSKEAVKKRMGGEVIAELF